MTTFHSTPNDDALALDTLEWAFSGRRFMGQQQHREVRQVITESRSENRESRGRRRSRLWHLGPKWARFA